MTDFTISDKEKIRLLNKSLFSAIMQNKQLELENKELNRILKVFGEQK